MTPRRSISRHTRVPRRRRHPRRKKCYQKANKIFKNSEGVPAGRMHYRIRGRKWPDARSRNLKRSSNWGLLEGKPHGQIHKSAHGRSRKYPSCSPLTFSNKGATVSQFRPACIIKHVQPLASQHTRLNQSWCADKK